MANTASARKRIRQTATRTARNAARKSRMRTFVKKVETALLDREEVAWLNAYHARVLAEVGPHLDATTRSWLQAACEPLV